MTLEQYSTDSLSLLPKGFRLQLLHKIPIIDICRLENTKFTSGIDIKSVWMELHKEYIGTYREYISTYCYGLNWRESIFRTFSASIIKGERPYGYYQVMNRGDKRTPWIGSDMNEDRPVSEHKVDFINYLVAVKRKIPVETAELKKNSIEDKKDEYYRAKRRYGPVNATMNHHEVTLVKGPVPPGKAYHEACRAKQFVPPRYTKFFSEGSCYLPDSTALKLIAEKCYFQPKDVFVHVPTFSTFVLNTEQELGSVNCLRDYFKDVESLTIEGKIEQFQMKTIIRGARYGNRRDIARCALGLMLLTPKPKLTSLTIRLSITDNVINSIAPALTAYGGLTELILQAYGISPDLQNLTSITEHQPLVHTVSILISKRSLRYDPFHFSPELSEVQLISWLQTCFKKPLLRDLKLSLDLVSLQFLFQIVTDFLSTPCSHEQTLTILCDLEELLAEAVKFPPKPSRVVKSEPPLPPKGPTLTSPSPPKLIHSSEPSDIPTTPIHQFDDACTVKYKCLTFDSCRIDSSFVKAFVKLAPLKLKNMSILKGSILSQYSTEFLSQLAQQPLIEMESLEVELGKEDVFNFDSILQNKLLIYVTVTCSVSCFTELSGISLRRGFDIKTIVEIPRNKIMFTLSRD